MLKYFVILSDLFLAAMPGEWYSCLNVLKHAITGTKQHAYQLSVLISVCLESQASLEKQYLLLLTSHRARQTGTPDLPGASEEGIQSFLCLWSSAAHVSLANNTVLTFPWLTTRGRCYSFVYFFGIVLCSWMWEAKVWFPNPQCLYF